MDHQTIERELLNTVGDWAAAEQSGDTSFLDSALTDDFVGIGPRGFALTKEQWIQRHESGDLKHDTFTWKNARTRVYADTAILTGRQTQSGQYKGRDIRGSFSATLVFVRPGGQWQLASLQLSPVSENS